MECAFFARKLNKNWYCLEFDLTGGDLAFMRRFVISMTELFYNELFHDNRKK